MSQYLIRRLALTIPTIIGITIAVFVLVRIMPGDIVSMLAGQYGAADAETRAALIREFQLDDNIVEQYGSWFLRIVRGDFGESLISGRTVSSEIATRLPVSLQLGTMALLVSVVLGVTIGIISATQQNTVLDYAGRIFAIGNLAAPNFWIALLLIAAAGRYFQWGVPPTSFPGLTSDPVGSLKFLLVPAILTGTSSSGSVMRWTRTTLLEVMRQDYVRTARAKGLTETTVIYKHALKNALIPVVTVIGLSLPNIMVGSIIIEQVYSIPGMGRYYLQSLSTLDFPIIQAIFLIYGSGVVLTNIAVDVTYAWLDPRIRYS